MRRVLITGGTGFVGRHLLPLFAGDELHVFDKVCGDFSEAIWHEIDLRDIERMRKLMTEIEPTHLLHTAWYVPPQEFWTSTENVAWIYRSFEILKSFAERGGKRAVFIGSCAEYDWRQDQTLSENSTPLNPVTLYGIAKKSLFELSTEFARQNNLSFAWARLFFMFGEGEAKGKFVRYVIESLMTDNYVECKNPDLFRDYLYVGEVAQALKQVLECEYRGAVNVASGEAVNIGEFVGRIAEIAGKPKLIKASKNNQSPNEPQCIEASIKILINEIGWKPERSLTESLNQYIKSYEVNN